MRAGRPRRNEQRELKVPMTFRLPFSVAQAVKDEAIETHQDMSDIARRALERDPGVRQRALRLMGTAAAS